MLTTGVAQKEEEKEKPHQAAPGVSQAGKFLPDPSDAASDHADVFRLRAFSSGYLEDCTGVGLCLLLMGFGTRV